MSLFKTVEQAGWTEKATAYDNHFAPISAQAVGPVLDLIGDISGMKMLDICCGTGDLAAAGLKRGAQVTGIDFAPTMIEIAKPKVPQATFSVGDAESLNVKDGWYDVAVCSFGLWHMAQPDRAIAEAARVLKPGGTFVYTTWQPPEKGWDLFEIIVRSIKTHGSMDVELPPSPPPFRFAEKIEAERTLTTYGFDNVAYHDKVAVWQGGSGQQVLDLIYKSTVRTSMIIEAQLPAARNAIKRDIITKAEAMRVNDTIKMRWPYALVSAKR